MADDLGFFGEVVGPRKGASKRTHGQKEDFCLRRWLIAMAAREELAYPVTVVAAQTGSPDFVLLSGDDNRRLGVEVTEAGEASFQEWLTRTEQSEEALLYPNKDGYVGAAELTVVREIVTSILRKTTKPNRYPAPCDLLVYENSEQGIFLEPHDIMIPLSAEITRRRAEVSSVFHQVHVIIGNSVYLNLLGDDFRPVRVPVGHLHPVDWVAWLSDQAAKLRDRDIDAVDYDHLAEELEALSRSDQRALESHATIVLLHLLKWELQPDRRGSSWQASITAGRIQLERLIARSHSLLPKLRDALPEIYRAARVAAVRQMGVELESVPEACPYSLDQILDLDFLPDPSP